MADEKRILTEQELENVTGGLFDFKPKEMIIVYTHEDGTQTQHPIYNYEEAWKMSNNLHAQNYREDTILKKMRAAGYVG